MTRAFPLPQNLVAAAEQQGRAGWLATLPATVSELAGRWDLEVGAPFQPGGQTAWVAPARRAGGAPGEDLVLKIGWRHADAEHEADALRAWDGRGAVLLLAAGKPDSETMALLLERCRPGVELTSLPEPEQDTVIAGILPRLWLPPAPGHPFRTLHEMCQVWADEFDAAAAAGRADLDPGLAREGMALFRALPASAERHVLLCTDLHAGNVLAAEREPWLAVDPNPHVGDPTYDALQHLLNCDARLQADPVGLTRRMAELLELDADRLLLWLFARCVQESPSWPGVGNVARRIAPG